MHLTLLIDFDLCSSVPGNAFNVAIPLLFFYTIKFAILNYPLIIHGQKDKRNEKKIAFIVLPYGFCRNFFFFFDESDWASTEVLNEVIDSEIHMY